jgi:hypothetical protein
MDFTSLTASATELMTARYASPDLNRRYGVSTDFACAKAANPHGNCHTRVDRRV